MDGSAILFQKKVFTSLIGHFLKMAKVMLIYPQQRVEVSYPTARSKERSVC
jgi:hypothetical protein